MRVTRTIHLVASGGAGFAMTDALDCNTWAIETGDGVALFDTGAGRDVDALLGEMQAGGIDPAQVRHIFLTHAHADHSGGAAQLMERLPGVTLHAGKEAALRMASNDERRISLDRARAFGVYPADYHWRGVAAGNVMADGEVTRVGGAAVRLVEAPGHSDDNCAFLVEIDGTALLVGGDSVFAGGKVILQDIPDCNVTLMLASIRRLANLRFESLLPGHGVFALRGGHGHVARARDYANTGLSPPSFF
jgi:glyoxylase-like metal-dependent hydrolase (beta-lactamase superfamily II)